MTNNKLENRISAFIAEVPAIRQYLSYIVPKRLDKYIEEFLTFE